MRDDFDTNYLDDTSPEDEDADEDNTRFDSEDGVEDDYDAMIRNAYYPQDGGEDEQD